VSNSRDTIGTKCHDEVICPQRVESNLSFRMQNPNQKFDAILSSIRERTALFKAFEEGATPEDIKQGVIQLLSPYFSNRAVLEEMAVNVLMGDAIEFSRLSRDRWTLELFEYALQVHQQAKARDAGESLKACSEWLPLIYEGLSVFWSQFHLELDKAALGTEEFMHECLRNMGSIIEGSIKPASKELLHQLRIQKGKKPSFQTINRLDLGNAIDELAKASVNPSFFAPRDVQLNQWRNIAQHFSASVQGDEIVCRYGYPDKQKEIRLTRSELMEVTKRILDTFAGLRLACHLFAIDSLPEMKARGLTPANLKVRPEMRLLNLVAGLASQGFDVVDFQSDEQGATLIIRDASRLDPNERRIHTTQLVEALWYYTHASVVAVEYRERDGTPNFLTRATRELFERIEKEGLPLTTVADEAEMVDLKTKQVIPKVPRQGGQSQ
jgi:hypothetical protein